MVIANGERALTNANIDSENIITWFDPTKKEMVIQVMGYNSGAGANVYCRNNTQCTIN